MFKSLPQVNGRNPVVCEAVAKDRPQPCAFHHDTRNTVLSSTALTDQPRIVLYVVSEDTRLLPLPNQRYVASRRFGWK